MRPTEEAIHQIMEEIRGMREPQKEMQKPIIGSTVTLKDGTTGIIKSIAPDGSLEIK